MKKVKKSVKKIKKNAKKIDWVLVLVMSVVFGQLGVDRFIMGHIWLGILKLITFGGIGVWWLIDLILVATKNNFGGTVIWK